MAKKTLEHNHETYMKAVRKVHAIRGFYNHLAGFFAGASLLIWFKPEILLWLARKGADRPDFLKWIGWNIDFMLFIWALVIFVSYMAVFRRQGRRLLLWLTPGFIKRWEERMLYRYLNEDEGKEARRNSSWN